MGEKIVVILHIYGVLAVFLLLWDHHENESELRGMKVGVDGPILTQKKHKRLHGTTIFILYNMAENVMVLLPIYGTRDI